MMMKRLLFFFSVSGLLLGCMSSDQRSDSNAPSLTAEERKAAMADSSNYTTVEWLDGTSQDLGKVAEGQVVEVSFRFRNAGKTNLIIEDVTAGCGCTVPEKPGKPYAPGEEGVIKAKFDSRGRKGPNDKYVTVKANTKPYRDHVLSFKIQVTE
jgi:hypothetical protein